MSNRNVLILTFVSGMVVLGAHRAPGANVTITGGPDAPLVAGSGAGLSGLIIFDTGAGNTNGTAGYVGANFQYNGNDSGTVNAFLGSDSASSNNPTTGTTRLGNATITLTGYVSVPVAGVYGFSTNSDDGSQLLIDGQTVAANNFPNAQGPTTASGTVTFANPGLYQIEVDYANLQFSNYTGGASLNIGESATATTSDPANTAYPNIIATGNLYQTATPEPASLGLLALGGLGLLARRRRTA